MCGEREDAGRGNVCARGKVREEGRCEDNEAVTKGKV